MTCGINTSLEAINDDINHETKPLVDNDYFLPGYTASPSAVFTEMK